MLKQNRHKQVYALVTRNSRVELYQHSNCIEQTDIIFVLLLPEYRVSYNCFSNIKPWIKKMNKHVDFILYFKMLNVVALSDYSNNYLC